jgi:hypothetical protein
MKERKTGRGLSRIGLIVYLILLFFSSNAAAQEEIFKEKTGRFVEAYNKKDFAGLVALFHFPKEYTEAELKADKEAIGKTLKLYFDEFGKITQFEKVENPPFYYFTAIGGADIPYWQKHPEGDQITYKVKFSQEGEGYLSVVFSYILKEWGIRQVNYGLPAEKPQSEKRISAIFQKWQKRMAQDRPDKMPE